MSAVEKAQELIFFDAEPTEGQKKLLQSIGDLTESKILGRLSALMETPPAQLPVELSHIAVEMIVRRFNRIGSEGLKSESISGHKAEYSTDDLSDFTDELKKWAEAHNEDSYKQGKVRFL